MIDKQIKVIIIYLIQKIFFEGKSCNQININTIILKILNN